VTVESIFDGQSDKCLSGISLIDIHVRHIIRSLKKCIFVQAPEYVCCI